MRAGSCEAAHAKHETQRPRLSGRGSSWGKKCEGVMLNEME